MRRNKRQPNFRNSGNKRKRKPEREKNWNSKRRKPEREKDRNNKRRKPVVDEPKLEVTNTFPEDNESESDTDDGSNNVYKKLLSEFNCVNKSSDIETDDESDDNEDQSNPANTTAEASESSEAEDIEDEEDKVEVQDTENESLDPFVTHLNFELNEDDINKESNSFSTFNQNWSHLGNMVIQIPNIQQIMNLHSNVILEEKKQGVQQGSVPKRIVNVDWSALHVKNVIQNNLTKANFVTLQSQVGLSNENMTPLQKELFSVINNYQDLLYPERSSKDSEAIRFLYCLHAVNHVLKTRTKILHHNERLTNKSDSPDDFRDQGLVRPKVLIIVPFRESARRVVNMLISILLPEDNINVIHRKRFMEEFSGGELIMPKKNPRPEDYEELFQGNIDDSFRLGIGVTKKSVKLFADFYSSDIIIASPLGLRMAVGAEGEERNFDFMASLEILILDQAEVFFMQNWDHILHIWNHFHLQPKESHGVDFSRVRFWALNGLAQYYRQTLIFSSIMLPEINSLFNRKCFNYSGKVKIINPIITGAVSQVVVQSPQFFHRFDVDSLNHSVEERLNFFVTKVLPDYNDTVTKRVMIYVPCYYDYVQLRNYFKKEEISFTQICEYSKENKIARARDMFFHRTVRFMLYSERFHFYRRVRVKGIQHIIFFQPPTFPHFYSEMCNLMQDCYQRSRVKGNTSVRVIYNKYDIQRLAGIVGSERASRMISSDMNVQMFVTEDK